MGKVKKVAIIIVVIFIGFCALSVIVATYFPTPEEPKKVAEVKKPKPQKKVAEVEKPKPVKKVVKKVEKPKVVAKKPEYTAEEVYRFALEYEVREGQSFAQILALAVTLMKAEGQSVRVVERQAQEYSIKGLWVVSCVVVAGGFDRTEIRLEADMRNKTVRPLNQTAKDLWGY